jgi:hypothetical protein
MSEFFYYICWPMGCFRFSHGPKTCGATVLSTSQDLSIFFLRSKRYIISNENSSVRRSGGGGGVTGREEGDGCGGGGTAVVSGGRLVLAVVITPFVEVRVGRRAMDAMGAPPQPQIDRRAELEGMVSEGRRRAGRHSRPTQSEDEEADGSRACPLAQQ